MAAVYQKLVGLGFVAQASSETIAAKLDNDKLTVYTGFDPTADSLHLGHLVPIMALAHLQRAGHRVLLLVGGATGMVGDPSGKSDERNLLTPEQVERNVQGLRDQLSRFLKLDGPDAARILNNNDWIGPMSFIDWLREVGKHFTVNYMLAKESVKGRIGSERGISFTEFSYMTMQAYDFLHLHDAEGCTLQIGGNDQWGNITAGIDLVRRVRAAEVFGLTCPLVTTSTGEKFGKSAGNSVWLDPARTSPYSFYQYWMNVDDRDAAPYLRLFTFVDDAEVAELERAVREQPGKRDAQRRLALEATTLVHGRDAAARAARASGIVFGGEVADLTDSEIEEVFPDMPSCSFPRERLAGGMSVVDLLVEGGAAKSKGEARKLLQGGGVYINNRRVEDVQRQVGPQDLASEHVLVLRTGKRNYRLIRFG